MTTIKSTTGLSAEAKPVPQLKGKARSAAIAKLPAMLDKGAEAASEYANAGQATAALLLQLFDKPVTVADAAKACNLALSTKGMDEADAQRPIINARRTALTRALRLAKLYKVGSKAGKPAKVQGGQDAAKDVSKAAEGKGKVKLIDVMLGNLANLTKSELERLRNATTVAIADATSDPAEAAAVIGAAKAKTPAKRSRAKKVA